MTKNAGCAEVVGKDLRLERWKVADLKPYENNPRIIDKAIPQVAESIKQCGYITPIVIDETGVILAGHTRLEALKQNGITECDVIVVSGITEEQARKYRILDNRTGELAGWDKAKLKTEIEDLDFNGFDFGQCEVITSSFEEEGSTEEGAPVEGKTVICPRCKAEVPV